MADFIDISGLLYPASVAVVGACDRAGDLGADTVERLVRCGFPGPVWAVGSGGTTVRNVSCVASVAELPQSPDLVLIALPAEAVAETIRACAARGTRHGVVFADIGAALQDEVAAACRDTGFTLCGPNSAGIVNAATPLVATSVEACFEPCTLRAGPISMVSQSGAIGLVTLAMVQRAGFGFRHLIDSGNEATVRLPDYLHGLAHDDGTRIIAAYMQAIGDGARLVRALEDARNQAKPVVLIRGGALDGEPRAFDAVLQELGVIRVRSVAELVDTCLQLAGTDADRQPRGRGVGIISIGGGHGVLAADQCATHGLAVPPLTDETLGPWRGLLASPANPLDVAPGTVLRADGLAQLRDAMEALASQPDIDSLLLVVGAHDVAADAAIGDMIADHVPGCAKPVCVSWPMSPPGALAQLAVAGIPVFDDSDRALRALAHLVTRSVALARPRREAAAAVTFDWDSHVEPGMKVVPEDRCHAILIDAGLPVARGRMAVDAAAALPIAHDIGLPVALKAITATVTRRAAAGLLATDLRNADEVLAAYRRLEDRARAREITLEGIYVQRMQRGGVELLVSVARDPVFGTMVTCGSGGALAELSGDAVSLRAPVTEAMAADMMARLRCCAAARDEQGVFDVAAPAAFIARLSSLGASAPWPAFTFEVNPVRWTRAGVVAMDGLLVIER